MKHQTCVSKCNCKWYYICSIFAIGEGPHGSFISWDKYYYFGKPTLMANWANKLECEPDPVGYPTDMDGITGWNCKQWIGCKAEVELVHCTGYFMHNYPFALRSTPYIEGTRILWNFMKNHKRKH